MDIGFTFSSFICNAQKITLYNSANDWKVCEHMKKKERLIYSNIKCIIIQIESIMCTVMVNPKSCCNCLYYRFRKIHENQKASVQFAIHTERVASRALLLLLVLISNKANQPNRTNTLNLELNGKVFFFLWGYRTNQLMFYIFFLLLYARSFFIE